MKRAIAVIVAVALLLLVADVLLRAAAENAAAGLIDERVAQEVESEVGLGGFPFLTSVVRGRFDRITVDIASASEDRLLVEDIHLTLQDVDLDALEVLGGEGDLRARSLRGRGVISEETLNSVVGAERPEVRIELTEGRIKVSRSGISAYANAAVAQNSLLIAAGEVLEPIEVPLPALLPDVRFSSLRPQRDGLVLGVVASRVTIRS